MKLSGVVCFEGLTAAGVRALREFEDQKLTGITFTFGPISDRAVVQWNSIARLVVVTRMAALVRDRQVNSTEPEFSLPQD
ncbi:MAG: hypothetical protein WB679_05720 [Terracidiphilus sp.]